MEAILEGQNAIRWRPWLLVLNRGAKLLLRGQDVKATSSLGSPGHKSELESALNSAGATHSGLDSIHALGCNVHEGALHELIPVPGWVKPQRRAVGHQVGHLLTLRELKHLRLVVSQRTR